ncbi:unannotated protein [freshwater metagenome]|uniref:Unannotated protein n=1 Tax=freshwater metagenome TaxID=449393 RepID=A0A6J6ASK3_9ZZZZ
MGRFGKRHSLKAPLGIATNFLGPEHGVKQPWDLTRHNAPRMGARPLFKMPVSPCTSRRHSEFDIIRGRLQSLTAETWQERREVHRRVDAIEIHVGDAGIDVPSTASHLIKTRWLE